MVSIGCHSCQTINTLQVSHLVLGDASEVTGSALIDHCITLRIELCIHFDRSFLCVCSSIQQPVFWLQVQQLSVHAQ